MKIANFINSALARRFPEKRLFLRTDNDTRFIRISPLGQLVGWTGSIIFVIWSVVATSFLLVDGLGSGSAREQAKREQALYEQRLNDLSGERDLRTAEALSAQNRFNTALEQISKMQLSLLRSEDRRREMESGIQVIQATLLQAMQQRDQAREEFAGLSAQLADATAGNPTGAAAGEAGQTVDFLTAALSSAAAERETQAELVRKAEASIRELELERDLMFEKNDRIFTQLEDAVSLSLVPLDKMFEAAGVPTERILDTVRRGYSGEGGPLMPLIFSTRGEEPDADSLRANSILERMDLLNLYRIAVEKTPFAFPVKAAVRQSSGFGPRNGRLHAGIDLAGAYGTPIYATADGVVKFAGRQSGYGLVVIITHANGLETRYAHQSRLRVKTGQRVSRGERIGDMGSSGRSSGNHVHYEIRVNNKPTNPMTFIKAARNVF
ncbi:MAG: DUF5930 domain-containing protein [Paracoccaceae bacterium]